MTLKIYVTWKDDSISEYVHHRDKLHMSYQFGFLNVFDDIEMTEINSIPLLNTIRVSIKMED